jgi:hypothetical protein
VIHWQYRQRSLHELGPEGREPTHDWPLFGPLPQVHEPLKQLVEIEQDWPPPPPAPGAGAGAPPPPPPYDPMQAWSCSRQAGEPAGAWMLCTQLAS